MATTPNMSIVKPVPLSDSNLVGATEVNTALDTIDAHNHTPGRGVQVPVSGLNINADLPMVGFQISGLKSVLFAQQASIATNNGLYFGNDGNLYVRDGAGNAIRITVSGHVDVSAAGAISGLPSGTASASYGAGTFQWQSATNTPAVCDTGDIALRKAGAVSPKRVLLSTVNSLAADIAITFPGSLPGSNLPLSMDASGNMTTGQIATAQIANGAVTSTQLASASVTSTQLAANAVTTAAILDANVTPAKLAAATMSGVFVSTTTTSTTFTTLATLNPFTVSGTRPVAFGLRWDGATVGGGYIGVARTSGVVDNASFTLAIFFNATQVAEGVVQCQNQGGIPFAVQVPASSLNTILAGSLSGGSYSVTLQCKVSGAGVTGTVNGCTLYAQEL